jgi:ubiquinol-cytochrome c reductase cytochrome c subunit
VRRRRLVLGGLAALFAAGSAFVFATAGGAQDADGTAPAKQSQPQGTPPVSYAPEQVAEGRALFVEGCSTCHGLNAEGIAGVAPDLRGVGAQAADFYVSTGRMPLDKPGDQPLRSHPAYSQEEIDALVAYIGSLGGPPIPEVHPERGDLAEGLELFSLYCAGCHQVGVRGGVVTDAVAPDLSPATATEIAEAVRVGPYVMPVFSEELISPAELDSVVRYVQLAQKPDNEGGWGIGNIGPIPEGMVAWFLGGVALLLCARLIGERNEP